MMKEMNSVKFKFFGFLFLLSVILAFTGCGGGGSSGSTGVSPIELEVQTTIDAISAAIKAENLADSMDGFDSNLRFYPANAQVLGGFEDFNQFRNRLSNFFNGATVIDFSITSVAVSPGLETAAMSRGQLNCSYTDSNGIARQINEQVEMKLEKVSKWGITEIYAYDKSAGQTGMLFPPQP